MSCGNGPLHSADYAQHFSELDSNYIHPHSRSAASQPFCRSDEAMFLCLMMRLYVKDAKQINDDECDVQRCRMLDNLVLTM